MHGAAAAAILHAEGKLAEALEAGVPAIRADDTPQAIKQGLVWAVESALALGDTERAADLLTTVESKPPGLRLPFVEAQTLRFRGRMTGDAEGLKAAASTFREYDIPFWLAVTLLEHAELTGDERSLAEAREIFDGLAATPWLERADRARDAVGATA